MVVMDDKNIIKVISVYIVKSYHCHGVSSKATLSARDYAFAIDCMEKCITGNEVYSCGSNYEGTKVVFSSDIDKMYVMPAMVVVGDDDQLDSVPLEFKERHEFCVLFSDTSKCTPGFARLLCKAEKLSKPEGYFSKIYDGKFLSSQMFFEDLLHEENKSISTKKRHPGDRKGPALRYPFDNIHGYLWGGEDRAIEKDQVYAIVCANWPVFMNEWLERRRDYNWPSRKLINKIRQFPCHYIPVGDASSEYSNIEWRLSFLLGERELLWNFNDTQIICLMILKFLRYILIEPRFPDQITTYHLKTTICWLSEEHGIDVWIPENLLDRVYSCFGYLLAAIKKHFLPHYFHRERNLFVNKMSSKIEKEEIIKIIMEIKNNLVDSVLTHGMPDKNFISRIWTEKRGDLNHLLYACKHKMEFHSGAPFSRLINYTECRDNGIFSILTTLFDNRYSFDQLKQIAESLDNDLNITPHFKSQVMKIINLLMGYRKFGDYLAETNAHTKSALMTGLYSRLEEGATFDSFTGKLYLASFLFSSNKYQLVVRVLSDILSKPGLLMYCGLCSPHYGMELGQSDGSIYINQGYILRLHIPINTAFDFVISESYMSSVPYPVQIECVLQPKEEAFKFVLIHPAVYCFFLLFLANRELGNTQASEVALLHLKKAVDDTGYNIQKYRALNLLGYCYYLSNDINQALECYKESICHTRRELPKMVNAAGVHVALLTYKICSHSL